MSAADHEKLAHSADVQMRLSVNGHVMSIGHLGPNYVILDNPIDHPPADAEISMSVDGRDCPGLDVVATISRESCRS